MVCQFGGRFRVKAAAEIGSLGQLRDRRGQRAPISCRSPQWPKLLKSGTAGLQDQGFADIHHRCWLQIRAFQRGWKKMRGFGEKLLSNGITRPEARMARTSLELSFVVGFERTVHEFECGGVVGETELVGKKAVRQRDHVAIACAAWSECAVTACMRPLPYPNAIPLDAPFRMKISWCHCLWTFSPSYSFKLAPLLPSISEQVHRPKPSMLTPLSVP